MGVGWGGEGWREQAYSTYNCVLRVHNAQPLSMPPDQPQGPRNTGILSFGLWCLQYCKTKVRNTNKVEHAHLSQRNTVGLYKRTREATFPQNSMRKWNCPCLFLLAAQVWKPGSTTHASRQHKQRNCRLHGGMGTPHIDGTITGGGKKRSGFYIQFKGSFLNIYSFQCS